MLKQRKVTLKVLGALAALGLLADDALGGALDALGNKDVQKRFGEIVAALRAGDLDLANRLAVGPTNLDSMYMLLLECRGALAPGLSLAEWWHQTWLAILERARAETDAEMALLVRESSNPTAAATIAVYRPRPQTVLVAYGTQDALLPFTICVFGKDEHLIQARRWALERLRMQLGTRAMFGGG
jgi:hypothetical protein